MVAVARSRRGVARESRPRRERPRCDRLGRSGGPPARLPRTSRPCGRNGDAREHRARLPRCAPDGTPGRRRRASTRDRRGVPTDRAHPRRRGRSSRTLGGPGSNAEPRLGRPAGPFPRGGEARPPRHGRARRGGRDRRSSSSIRADGTGSREPGPYAAGTQSHVMADVRRRSHLRAARRRGSSSRFVSPPRRSRVVEGLRRRRRRPRVTADTRPFLRRRARPSRARARGVARGAPPSRGVRPRGVADGRTRRHGNLERAHARRSRPRGDVDARSCRASPRRRSRRGSHAGATARRHHGRPARRTRRQRGRRLHRVHRRR